SQRTTGTGTRSPETGKLSTALVVSPPQSCSVKVLASIEVVVLAAYWRLDPAGDHAPAGSHGGQPRRLPLLTLQRTRRLPEWPRLVLQEMAALRPGRPR